MNAFYCFWCFYNHFLCFFFDSHCAIYIIFDCNTIILCAFSFWMNSLYCFWLFIIILLTFWFSINSFDCFVIIFIYLLIEMKIFYCF
jgi:hypothetical protein